MSSTVGVTLRPSRPYALLARLLLLCVESVRTWGAWVFGGDAPGLSLKGGETSVRVRMHQARGRQPAQEDHR
jgi:hypothetical protein